MFAGGRLFFRPEDTPKGRHPSHGQDEVLLWNRTVVLRCSEVVEWHLRAQMAPLWPSGTVATYRPEWEEVGNTTQNALTEAVEDSNSRDNGGKKSSVGINDVGRPSLLRTSLFASGLAVCELEDIPYVKERLNHDMGKNSTPRVGASQKQAAMTQQGLTHSQKKGLGANAQKQAASPGNGRRGRAVAANSKQTSLQKRGHKKVSPRSKKAVSKRGNKLKAVVSQNECSIGQELVTGGTCAGQADRAGQSHLLQLKSESNCSDSHRLEVKLVHTSGASKNPASLVDVADVKCHGCNQSNVIETSSHVSIKFEPPCSSESVNMLNMKPKHDCVDIKGPEQEFTEEHSRHMMEHAMSKKMATSVQSMPGRTHCMSQRRSVNPAAPLLARARKIKFEKKRRQSREQMELETEDGGDVIVRDGVQSSGLDDHEVEENAQKSEEDGQKPQQRRGRKRKKIDTEVVNQLNSSQRRITVRRTSIIVKRDITELFALCASFSSPLPTIVLVSYSHYCRYKALQLRLAEYERLWCHPDIESMTGMKVTDDNTRLLFCRALFKNPNLLKLGVTMAMSVPSFVKEERGRRKRRGSTDISDITMPAKKNMWSEEEAEHEFMQSLEKFMAERLTPIGPPPRMGFQSVNLFAFFNCIQQLGGYDKVTATKQWRDVYQHLGGTTLINSAAASARKQYEKYLLAYERYVQSGPTDCMTS